MSFSFHPEAEEEFNKAIDYYENIELGLGYDFALEVYSTIQRTVEFPRAWAVLEGEIKRSLVGRFPYGVLYSHRAKRNIYHCGDGFTSQTGLLAAQKIVSNHRTGTACRDQSGRKIFHPYANAVHPGQFKDIPTNLLSDGNQAHIGAPKISIYLRPKKWYP